MGRKYQLGHSNEYSTLSAAHRVKSALFTGIIVPPASKNPNPQTVLIVDDEPSARATIEALLKPMGLELPMASSGPEAIQMCHELQPDLVLLDVMMPQMDGFEVCRRLRADARTSGLPVVMVTALQDRESRLHGIEAGADDFLTKPIDRLELRARVRTTLRLNRYRRELEQRKRVVQTLEGSLSVMKDMLALADTEAFGQSSRLQEMAAVLGAALDYRPLWELTMAASLCQLGRVVVPAEVREKLVGGGKLNATESRMLTRVPKTGSRLLSHVPAFQGVAQIVLWQDKRFDGTGFPFETRAGDAIPLGARILHLLRAILRLEAGGLSRTAALLACEAKAGHFDPDIVAKAKEVFTDIQAVDSLVTLMELKAGMITRSPIKEKSGRLLVGPGIQITEALVRRLSYIHETRGLQEPFEIQLLGDST